MRWGLAAAIAGALAAGCAAGGSGGGAQDLLVLAASSLSEPFEALAADFEAAHPGVRVRLALAGSQTLVTQLQEGVPADVLATADVAQMDRAGDLVAAAAPFAGNRLVVAVPRGNPGAVHAVEDLARPGVQVVLAARDVPAGEYARSALEQRGLLAAVQPNVVSEEVEVRGVLAKLVTGDADAGIVYATDARAAGARVEVAVEDLGVEAVYAIARVSAARLPGPAESFVALVRSDQGRDRLAAAGFTPP